VGIYAVLGWMLNRLQADSRAATPTRLPQANYAVQIVEPLDGAVLQISSTVTVRSAVMESGFVQAELHVDGRRVAVQVNQDPSTIPWIVQWDWNEPDEGSHVLVIHATSSQEDVDTSLPVTVTIVPEGRLVFASNRNGAYAVYDMQADGSDLARLTSGPGNARQPAIGTGGRLAYVTESQGGRSMIRILEGGEQEGTDLLLGVEPAWAPDGTRLAYSANVEGVSQVVVVALDGGAPTQVTAEEAYAGQPTWSPDGSRLAYVVEQEGNWDIWVSELEGGVPQRLTSDPAMDWAPSWSPDGSKVAFVSDRGGSHQIYTMQPDGTKVRQLSDFANGAEGPSWSPDGFWLAFVAYSGEGAGINAREIYLMRSDGQNPVRLTYNAHDETEVEWAWSP
jgi:Tol biopolymer transport system component